MLRSICLAVGWHVGFDVQKTQVGFLAGTSYKPLEPRAQWMWQAVQDYASKPAVLRLPLNTCPCPSRWGSVTRKQRLLQGSGFLSS